jgi:hypothetical protein
VELALAFASYASLAYCPPADSQGFVDPLGGLAVKLEQSQPSPVTTMDPELAVVTPGTAREVAA